jgi:hypothetical protein
MKNTSLSTLAALCLAAGAAHGFSLDFISDVGANLPPDLVINVPGYGNVQFSPLAGSALVVGTTYQTGGLPTPSLQFDAGEIVLITFLEAPVSDLAFDYIDVSPGESMNTNVAGPNSFTVQLTSGTNGAGLQEITFSAVPETSAATLGLLGTGLLVLRRRR